MEKKRSYLRQKKDGRSTASSSVDVPSTLGIFISSTLQQWTPSSHASQLLPPALPTKLERERERKEEKKKGTAATFFRVSFSLCSLDCFVVGFFFFFYLEDTMGFAATIVT